MIWVNCALKKKKFYILLLSIIYLELQSKVEPAEAGQWAAAWLYSFTVQLGTAESVEVARIDEDYYLSTLKTQLSKTNLSVNHFALKYADLI